jgi:hypothetical protein
MLPLGRELVHPERTATANRRRSDQLRIQLFCNFRTGTAFGQGLNRRTLGYEVNSELGPTMARWRR